MKIYGYSTMKKSNWHGGKGSGRRSSQDDNKYADNWDIIFGKKKKGNKNESNTQIQKDSKNK